MEITGYYKANNRIYIAGRIARIRRGTTSSYGNPSFVVDLMTPAGMVTYRTAANASVAYKIDNSEYRGVPVELELTESFRIVGIRTLNHDIVTFTLKYDYMASDNVPYMTLYSYNWETFKNRRTPERVARRAVRHLVGDKADIIRVDDNRFNVVWCATSRDGIKLPAYNGGPRTIHAITGYVTND